MTTENSPPKKQFSKMLFGGATLAVVVGIGLYAFNRGADNPASGPVVAKSCLGAPGTIAAITPFAKGELAAFQPVDRSIDLTEIPFKDKDGKTVTLADWKGRTVLLNLWATWCPPCIREMPSLQKLQVELGGDNFEVVPVSIDLGDDSKPKAFYKKIGLTQLPFYADSTMEIFNTLKKKNLAFGMPTTILIDKEGCSVGVLNGPAEWASNDAFELIKSAL